MKKIYLSGNYVTVIYDGTNERLYPVSQVQLSEFTDHFLIENRIENQPKDTQVSFAQVGTWFNEDGSVAYTVETLRAFFAGLTESVSISDSSITEVKESLQGYYSLLSGFYFGGVATERVITTAEADTWIDIELTIDPSGTFEHRPTDMITAQAVGHTGTGANGSRIAFLLEGLTQSSTASVRAAMTFDPDEDGGRFESKILFTRHSGASPSIDFAIEANSLIMESGADTAYAYTPNTQFFVGDTINTYGVGDAGTVRLQVKTDVAGTLQMREIALFIQS